MGARIVVVVLLVLGGLAGAAEAACPDAVAKYRGLVVPASFRAQAALPGNVRVTFTGHATFDIVSPEGVRVVTDYTDLIPIEGVPDIITMNRFHISHYSNYPDPRIPHVLRGWNPAGGIARHNLQLRDMRVRNIQTNFGEFGDIRRNENSIFVFEVATLCFAHMSHTHHILGPETIAELGEIDILFAPIDGMYTMSFEELFDSIAKIKPKMVIPMHITRWLGRFVEQAEKLYPVKHTRSTVMVVNRDMLPAKTEVVFMEQGRDIPGWPGFFGFGGRPDGP
jgi:L-ascorbate metabolism protein UlaG (beta-lactamase superfamily)